MVNIKKLQEKMDKLFRDPDFDKKLEKFIEEKEKTTIMNKVQGNEPAFTKSGTFDKGLSKREYACIHLQIPESGTPWLDELIAKKQRQSIAERAMNGVCKTLEKGSSILSSHAGIIAEESILLTDALLNELNKK